MDAEKSLKKKFIGKIQKNSNEKLELEQKKKNELNEDEIFFIRGTNFRYDRVFNLISKSWQMIKYKQLNLKFEDSLMY